MYSGPAVLAVVPQAVDVATEVGSIAAPTVHSMTLVAHLIIQHIRLYFNLSYGENGQKREQWLKAFTIF